MFRFLILIGIFVASSGCSGGKGSVSGEGAFFQKLYLAQGTASEAAIIENIDAEVGQEIELLPLMKVNGGSASNVAVTWILEGTVGDLTIESGGKKAVLDLNSLGSATIKIRTTSLEKIVNISVSGPTPPVASGFSAPTFNEDEESIVELEYTDDKEATTCEISSLSNVSVTTACSCLNGVCSVGVTGALNYEGSASFNYLVKTNGQASNSSTATLNIAGVNDAPSISHNCKDYLMSDTYSCTLTASDPDSSSFTWSLASDPCGYFSINSTTGVLTGTIPSSASSSCTTTVSVSDGSLSSGNTDIDLDLATCPAGYIPVPSNSSLGVNAFCVMQFEAKNIGGVPTSQAETVPWRSISATNAKSECQSLGTGYDLISNYEWMTIALDIESNPQNWTSGVVGNGCLRRGNNGLNDACGYNGSDPEYGTGRNTKARSRLLNGYSIWDFAGNLAELTDWVAGGSYAEAPANCDGAWTDVYWNTCSGLSNDTFRPENPAAVGGYNSDKGLGRMAVNTYSTGGVIRRGGSYTGTVNSGVFSIQINQTTSWSNSEVGFRCVFRP